MNDMTGEAREGKGCTSSQGGRSIDSGLRHGKALKDERVSGCASRRRLCLMTDENDDDDHRHRHSHGRRSAPAVTLRRHLSQQRAAYACVWAAEEEEERQWP